jgi:hypothetical protein
MRFFVGSGAVNRKRLNKFHLLKTGRVIRERAYLKRNLPYINALHTNALENGSVA